MAQFKLVDNAVADLTRGGGANWIDLTNTDAAQFNTVLVTVATFDNANVTVADFIASGSSEAGNYVRQVLGNPAYADNGDGTAKWDADDLNIEISGGTCTTNYIGIYQMQPGTGDSDRNIICIGDLGSGTAVSDGSNLVIQFAAGGILVGDDPNA